MASLSKQRTSWVIQYVDRDGVRKSFYPGQMPKKAAEAIKRHVEQLVVCRKARTVVPVETAAWVADCGAVMREKLEHHGLIEAAAEPEAEKLVSLGDFTLGYIDGRGDVKASSKGVWRRTRNLLLKFFPADRSLASITVADAKDWRQFLLKDGKDLGGGLAENTVRKACSIACQMFADALDRGLVALNPFKNREVPRCVRENRSRDVFVTRETADRVLAADPDVEGRLIFALSRYGGLRCPSEHLAMTWPDVDWKAGRVTVRSPKTEHHEGKGSRVIPLFPELLPYLRAAYDAAEDKTGHVIARHRHTNAAIPNRLKKILDKAGIPRWGKLFMNCRASFETELAAKHPIHVVCEWVGHSVIVAKRNYLQVRDEDFARASGNALQHTPADSGNMLQGVEQPKSTGMEKPKKRGKTQDQLPKPLQSCQVSHQYWRVNSGSSNACQSFSGVVRM